MVFLSFLGLREWSLFFPLCLEELALSYLCIPTRAYSSRLKGSVWAKRAVRVGGSFLCNSFQKSDPTLTPAIKKFFFDRLISGNTNIRYFSIESSEVGLEGLPFLLSNVCQRCYLWFIVYRGLELDQEHLSHLIPGGDACRWQTLEPLMGIAS